MNLHTETASLELRAAAFREHGHCAITDLTADDAIQLVKLIGVHPMEIVVEAGVLRNLHHDATVAPSSLCTRTYEERAPYSPYACPTCKRPAWAHPSVRDTPRKDASSPDLRDAGGVKPCTAPASEIATHPNQS